MKFLGDSLMNKHYVQKKNYCLTCEAPNVMLSGVLTHRGTECCG